MNYSNINNTEHFYKFKMKKFGKGVGKVSKGVGKVGQGAFKGVSKTGFSALDKINPLNQVTKLGKAFGLGGGSTKIISFVCSFLVCLMLIAFIIFKLKS